MAVTDEERLVVAIEARIAQFEKNMLKAERTGSQNFNKLRSSSKSATRQMEQDMVRSTTRINQALAATGTKIGAFGKAFAVGIVGGIAAGGIAGVIAGVQGIADAVAEVGDQAKMAGLSTKVFQEWKYVAEQARIPIDAITDGLKEMQLRADEFAVTGKGSAAEAFQRLGLTPQEVKEKLKDPSELLLLLIERTRLLKDTAAGVRIFDELFGGTGGERMVALIEQGEAGIRKQIQAANDFSHVLNDEVIQKAQEIDRQFNTIANTVGNTLKSAIVSVVGSMMDFMEGLRSIENQRSTTIQKSINDIMAQKQEVARALAAVDAADSRLNERQRTKARGTHEERMRQLNEQENALIHELENRPEVMNFRPTSNTPWTPPKYTPPPSNTGGSKTSATEARAQRERDAVKELIAELEEELRLVNQSDAAKRASAASRQAGAAATDAERQKVISLTEAIHREEEARRRAEEQMMLYRDLTRSGLDDLFAGLEQGKGFWDSMADVAVNSLKRIADSLIDDVLDSLFKVNNAAGGGGGGLFGSLFGGLFGGGGTGTGLNYFPPAPGRLFAKGGVADQPSIFAEAGPEAAVPLPDGRRIPVDLGNSQAGTVSVSIAINIDATGADAAGLARLQRELTTLKKDLPGKIVAGVKNAQTRRSL